MAVAQTLRLAHRGDHRHAREDSLAALLAAMDVPGCDGVEFDVRASSDGVPVLLHDPTLERVQGRPEAVGELTADELDRLGVPRLADVLEALPRRAFLDVELKEPFGRPLIEILAAGRGPEIINTVVSSFDPATIARIRDLVPTWPCWLIARDMEPATIATAEELGCVGIAAQWRAINTAGMAAARNASLAVMAWTVTRRSTYARLVQLGVAAICVEGEALEG
ncbi:MAG: glycerophosphoryl diester phosphodiesterase [Chloroflexota bacterium]|nr:glycerophosphoryl diester phosphodiesterase [Chloroflexota bacterium]